MGLHAAQHVHWHSEQFTDRLSHLRHFGGAAQIGRVQRRVGRDRFNGLHQFARTGNLAQMFEQSLDVVDARIDGGRKMLFVRGGGLERSADGGGQFRAEGAGPPAAPQPKMLSWQTTSAAQIISQPDGGAATCVSGSVVLGASSTSMIAGNSMLTSFSWKKY